MILLQSKLKTIRPRVDKVRKELEASRTRTMSSAMETSMISQETTATAGEEKRERKIKTKQGKSNMIYYAGAAIVVGVAAYFLMRKNKNK
jgi:hypothetical protein